MYQEIFRIPWLNLPIYGYGLMMVVGFLVSAELARYLARRSGINPEVFINAAVWALITGVIGARISHVLENLPEFTDPQKTFGQNLWNMANVSSGGLTFYGGFLLATPALICYALWKGVPLRRSMDIIAPCLMLGLGFGRIGCFMNGCCYGAESNVPWAITFPYHSIPYLDQVNRGEITPPSALLTTRKKDWGAELVEPRDLKSHPQLAQIAATQRSKAVHPAQLYSAFNAFLLALLLTAYYTVPHAWGRGFALMLILEGATRYILELLRVEPPLAGVPGNMSLSMLIGILLVGGGFALWWLFGRFEAGDLESDTPRAAAAGNSRGVKLDVA